MCWRRPHVANEYNREVRIIFNAILIACIAAAAVSCGRVPAGSPDPQTGESVETAFKQHQSNIYVSGEGVVSRVLSDDTSGLPHQRFILRLQYGKTVLIEHNTEVASR